MIVTLTWTEQFYAAQAGVMRRLSAANRKRSQPLGKPKSMGDWDKDIESCGAEAAVAKALGLYWQAVDANPHQLNGDVSGIEVRSTKRKDGRLILHTKDPDDRPFVLVRGEMPTYDVVGWIMGRDGKKMDYTSFGDGRPAFFVPAKDLLPMDELEVRA